jgi:hypothetical protein
MESSIEGTMFMTIRFPFPWPVPDPVKILSNPCGDACVSLTALTDGRLSFRAIDEAQNEVGSFLSPPLSFSDRGFVILGVRWGPAGCQLSVNFNELQPDGPGVPTVSISVFGQENSAAPDAFTHPTAGALCKKWIDNRKAKFATPKPIGSTHRIRKSIEDETKDLKGSVVRLRDITQQVLNGKSYLLGTLAAEIRALVHWKKDAARELASPLLLRMASKGDMPLPVFFIKHRPLPPMDSSPAIHFEPEVPRRFPIFPTDELQDLQDWLESPVLTIGPSPARTESALRIISELANTAGGAHYDEDSSEHVELLRTILAFHMDALMRFVCETALLVASQAEWVLSQLRAKKLIA